MAAKFVPDKKGFVEFRNERFVQNACLKKAQEVAALAGGISGCAFGCDVRPGKTRCHARASGNPTMASMGKKYWNKYGIAESDESAALQDAAKRLGGQAKHRK